MVVGSFRFLTMHHHGVVVRTRRYRRALQPWAAVVY
jgi:hypothetical protein